MIVVDASALTEYLLDTALGRSVAERMLGAAPVHLPHLASIETASAVRGAVLGRQIDAWQGEQAMVGLADLRAVRHAHEPFLPRVWKLRANVSAYDAIYVALAEALDAPLLTCDARLARAPLTGVTIEVVEGSN